MRKFLPVLRVIVVVATIAVFFGIPSLVLLEKHGITKNSVKNYVNITPQIVSIPPLNAKQGEEYIYRLNIKYFNKDKHYIEVQRPGWLNWDDSLWILSGKVQDKNDFNIKIKVIDVNTHEVLDSQDFVVKVVNVQDLQNSGNVQNESNDMQDASQNNNSHLEIVQKHADINANISNNGDVLGAYTDDNNNINSTSGIQEDYDSSNEVDQIDNTDWQDPFIINSSNVSNGQVLGASTNLPTTAISPIDQMVIGIGIFILGIILYTKNIALRRHYRTESGLDILVVTGKND